MPPDRYARLRGGYTAVMCDVTYIVSPIEPKNQKASAELMPIVDEEPRKLSADRMASELQEAYPSA